MGLGTFSTALGRLDCKLRDYGRQLWLHGGTVLELSIIVCRERRQVRALRVSHPDGLKAYGLVKPMQPKSTLCLLSRASSRLAVCVVFQILNDMTYKFFERRVESHGTPWQEYDRRTGGRIVVKSSILLRCSFQYQKHRHPRRLSQRRRRPQMQLDHHRR